MEENKKLAIFEAVALLMGILAAVFTSLPAYFEDGRKDMSIMEIIMGDGRTQFNPLLMFGFILLILGIVAAAVLAVLHFLNKTNDLMTTLIAIGSIVLLLIGTILLSCSVFIAGLDKLNSELGLVQGAWGFRAGNILVPIFGLLAIAFSYPSAMIIPHHKDVTDKK